MREIRDRDPRERRVGRTWLRWLGVEEGGIDRAWGAARGFRIVAVVATAVAALTVAAAPAGAVKPRAHSALYRDTPGEDLQAPDITSVIVSDDRRTVTFRVWVANRPQMTSDMGLQLAIDSDRRQATGNDSLVWGLGADRLIQMIGGTTRLLRWDSGSNRWLAGSSQPVLSYDSGWATITVRMGAVGAAFTFAVSAASGLIVERDGAVDITTAHFDFAPDVGHGGWRYRR